MGCSGRHRGGRGDCLECEEVRLVLWRAYAAMMTGVAMGCAFIAVSLALGVRPSAWVDPPGVLVEREGSLSVTVRPPHWPAGATVGLPRYVNYANVTRSV